MCGLAFTHNADVIELTNRLQHRGPDNTGKWEYNGIELGHTRLSIIDLSSASNQPLITDRYVMSFVGEVYNFKELFSYLNVNDDLADHTLPGDSIVLIKYFQKYGIEKTLRDINGMFAIVLYDKIENKVHLICDRFGQKSIYYYHDNQIFAAASCPSALLHLKEKWQISEQGLTSYWKLGATMCDSIWDGIKRVYASEIVSYDIKTKRISTSRYWQPEYKPNEDIRELIIDSIKKVKVADVPVYIFLSGGIDSSVVASQGFQHAVHMDGPELRYAEQVAQRFGINLHVVSPGKFDAVECMTDYVQKCGEPSMAALIPYIVSRETSKLCKVAVSANGADELFFGYDRTTEHITHGQLDHIFRSNITNWNYPTSAMLCEPRMSAGRWLELTTYVQHDLNKTLDFASMAHGLEVRAPFLDHRLVEAALSVQKEKIGRKALLKDMLRGMGFNDQFLNRPKMGFTLYQKPTNYDVDGAYVWCVKNGWLKDAKRSPRDNQYLKASAFSFKVWWDTFKEKIA